MLASLLIVFREVLEAGLIVGIVLAATVGVPGRARFVAGGILAGVVGASLVALFAGALSNAFSGNGQELFNASILLVAVVMLGWHNTWMASHGRELAQEMKTVGKSVAAGEKSLLAMAVVVAIAVLREGSEVVLFLYGIAASTHDGPAQLLLGGALGIVAGGAVSWLLYRGLVAIPMRYFFTVTNWMIALLAAGMAGQAAAILARADILPSWGDQLWDTSGILPDNGMVGRALHALAGYSDRPSGIQLGAYVLTLAVLVILARTVGQPRPRQPQAVPQGH
jgi:high-affinity iron transporter